MSESRAHIEIPHEALSPTALRGVIEFFVLREGTDYGEREVSLDWKVASVLRQLECGEARILSLLYRFSKVPVGRSADSRYTS